MANVLIVAYLLIVLALIAVILLQRSEGGGLGMGGNTGGLMTVRGSANLLTRTTAILATLFFATAIGLTILSELDRGTQGILDRAMDGIGEGTESTPTNVLDALNQMNAEAGGLDIPALPPATTTTTTTDTPATDPGLAVPATDPALAVPVTETPAEPAAEAPTVPLTEPAETPAAPAN